ncbi:MAG: RagB/SusD family nutrient uptake outer membrane protein [Chitinophagaceae bacterium]|nr:MAG: RagB/SusD family nutrient uptake outer membrane protein [Chitinophagaceae bacterium]
MKSSSKNILYLLSLSGMLLSSTACKKNYSDPSSVDRTAVGTTAQSLSAAATGLQRVYTAGRASSLFNRITVDGLLTNQFTVLNQGNVPEYQLQQGGGTVDGTNTMINGLWTTSNKIIFDADYILDGASRLGDRGFASGLIGYTTIFKALALGDMAMYWQKIPASVGQNVAFEDRIQGYNRAIASIDAALASIQANPISTNFATYVPAGIDIVNTLHALKARYSLFAGNYTQALASANNVDLTKKSVLNFSTVNLNPIFETSTSTNNVVAATTTFGLPATLPVDANDKRIPFYLTNAYASKILGFGAGATTAWPIYLPGEMTLIKAEAYARMSTPDLVNAQIELNKVVTKQRTADPFGVGAELAPVVLATQQDVLDEIYRQRAVELSLSGLRVEDQRRFARPVAERKRSFLPYPFQERDNNPNTPPDPTF